MREVKGLTGVVEKDGVRMPKVLFDWGVDFNGWHEGNALLTPVWWELKLIKEMGVEEYVRQHFYQHGKPLVFKGKEQWTKTREGALPFLWDQFLRHQKPETVLDVGCGQGELGIWYSSQGVQYTGVDIALVNVGFCIALLPCMKYLMPDRPMPIFGQMLAERLAFEAKSFDIVFSCHALEHVQNLDLAFEEQARVGKWLCGVIALPREDESGEHLQQISKTRLAGYLARLCDEECIHVFPQELVFWGRVK